MDPITGLGLVASVIQIIGATSTAIKYLNDAKDAPKDRAQLAQKVTNILVLLTQLRYRLEGADTKGAWYDGIRRLGIDNGPLQQLHRTMVSFAKNTRAEVGHQECGESLTLES